jgi:DnaJ domain
MILALKDILAAEGNLSNPTSRPRSSVSNQQAKSGMRPTQDSKSFNDAQIFRAYLRSRFGTPLNPSPRPENHSRSNTQAASTENSTQTDRTAKNTRSTKGGSAENSTGTDRSSGKTSSGVSNLLQLDEYYKLLGVDANASDTEVKQAYRKLALRCHPDKNKGDLQAEEKFKVVTDAYENVLKSRGQHVNGQNAA